MARRAGEETGLPSFFRDNPWLDILAQRGAEPSPDSVASEASSVPTTSKAMPSTEPEHIVSSPVTPPTIGFSRELVVRLEVSSELIKAIRELKEAIITVSYTCLTLPTN